MFSKIVLMIHLWGLASCTTIDSSHPPSVSLSENPSIMLHTIQEGETLWHISKIYNVDLNDLTEKNNITDSNALAPGQSIAIPSPKTSKNMIVSKKNMDFIWPINGDISEYFNQKSNGVTNKGINIAGKNKQDIIASCEGKVIFVGDLAGYGKTLIINHADNLATVYCGSSDILVKKGQKVNQGMIIAKSGISPRVNQPTLHFEIRKKHKPQNPLFYLN